MFTFFKRQEAERDSDEVAANARIQAALDTVSANVMLADPELNIIYLNKTVQAMFKSAEADIRRDLPGFDSSRLPGTNIDAFHRNPAHQRSATAAKEIKALIQDSVAGVDEGSRLVNESGRVLEDIVASVKKVTDIVAEIAAASREQSAGIEQVNKAVMQIYEGTQQNAALVEQATAASEAILDQARQLNAVVARFDAGEGAARAAAGRPAAMRRSA